VAIGNQGGIFDSNFNTDGHGQQRGEKPKANPERWASEIAAAANAKSSTNQFMKRTAPDSMYSASC